MRLGRRAAILALLLPIPALAQAVDHKQGVLGHLSVQIGTTNTPQVVNDPAVRRTLSALLGEPGVRLLNNNLQLVAPIAFDGTALVLRGARQEAVGEQEAFLSIRPRDGIMEVAILTAGRVRFVSQRPMGERSEMLEPQLIRWGVGRGVPLDERRVPPAAR
ncbi:hypothetical protein KTR66_17270 [Roseococcus sp. SDR]|uniref:hypothetical protein n=1 Tax=Roseococcus sp. SDR TaxID=2835532 RepID=UPI001BD1686A|nr:hypothetical protein [Roseococcus sp. SDR]MBS7791755.1 hypothetical protein [Roseococcus sp. SDR]MBV1847069.1 hypothetical protein [Roseococcus sp. SDR]